MDSFTIIYPERRQVSGDWIISQTSDAIANGEVDADFQDAVNKRDAHACAMALHDAGLVTLGR